MNQIKYHFLFVMGKLRRHFYLQYPETERDWALSRIGYIINYTAVNALNALVSGSILAALLRELGMTDAQNGIFSMIPTTVGMLQLLFLYITRGWNKVKLPTVLLCPIGNALFGVMVFIPFTSIPGTWRSIVFMVIYATGSLMNTLIGPRSNEWMVSLIPSSGRARFIGIKDGLNFLFGGVFSMAGATFLDYYTARGMQEVGFRIIGITVIAIAAVEFVGLNMCKEPREGRVYMDDRHEAVGSLARRLDPHEKPENFIVQIVHTLKSKAFIKVISMYFFWNTLTNITNPFLNIYYINDLKLSYTYISLGLVVARILCALVFPAAGRLGDKKSYMYVMRLGVVVTGFAFALQMFCRPGPAAQAIYMVYMLLYYFGTGVMGIGMASILYTAPDKDNQAMFWTLEGTICAFPSFIASLLGGWILDSIQKNGFSLFGLSLYGQQVLSSISFVLAMAMYAFTKTVCKDMEKLGKQ